ncbi:ParA family protein [Burkholderia cenocepacia]|uniref:ParA family protein n=1 Tax=Burkholderia cenocepacia TaxID=95486 RepID=UPI00209B5E4D|nr:ParA family protein [Burkholderia cenocepacia]
MVITVGAEKGGVGKTRLATHIAALAATNDVDVVLLDTDKQGSAMSWSRIRNEEGVTPAIPVLALPANPARELANLANKYTLVVVDIGAQNYRTMLECALLSDLVLVPCGPDQQEVESTLNVFATLKDMGRGMKAGDPCIRGAHSGVAGRRIEGDCGIASIFEKRRHSTFRFTDPTERSLACDGQDRAGRSRAEGP